ncbi:hypothetical protein [Pontibacter actiniarum]|uniref:Uncharacterized protein n=1 Tax=Pontibacter actiniarum TaxID=323450 RepID=A0A1X9YRL1_9BACT|nr:hypothetical protein [Pontibacter actiniarum]ARS35481.1 hypothetical protein CA264_08530 [Pontibacter actiniarum]
MEKSFVLAVFLLAAFSAFAQSGVPSPEVQIKSAVLAAPAEKREGAAVWGYNQQGELVQLRKGTNEMVCLADDPAQKGFSSSCYHRDLEPFMARGRALRKAGKDAKEIFATREREAKSGKLAMPKQPASLFVFSADDEDFDRSSGEVENGYLRYVVYIPFATAEGTGLPLKAASPGMPWIMYPGTHGAHIMINPPRE